MINMFKLTFLPNALCWMYKKGQAQAWLAWFVGFRSDISIYNLSSSDKESSSIHLYDGRGGSDVLKIISGLHSLPVHIMRYHPYANTVVSIDEGGMVEYWEPTLDKEDGHINPKSELVSWKFKSETDLYEFKKVNIVKLSHLIFKRLKPRQLPSISHQVLINLQLLDLMIVKFAFLCLEAAK